VHAKCDAEVIAVGLVLKYDNVSLDAIGQRTENRGDTFTFIAAARRQRKFNRFFAASWGESNSDRRSRLSDCLSFRVTHPHLTECYHAQNEFECAYMFIVLPFKN